MSEEDLRSFHEIFEQVAVLALIHSMTGEELCEHLSTAILDAGEKHGCFERAEELIAPIQVGLELLEQARIETAQM